MSNHLKLLASCKELPHSQEMALVTSDVEGKPYVEVLKKRSGPNIKVDKGIFDLARINGEAIT
jgi:methenyltetrahydromethanopterin cyclohydrolase